MEIDISRNEEGYIKSIEIFRKLALIIPSLSISLSSACLAFDIYFIKYVYRPVPGLDPDDVIVLLPIIAGIIFLVAAAFSLDWYVDSMSSFELKALNSMRLEIDDQEYKPATLVHNGFLFRSRLLCCGYLLFSTAISLMMFLLASSIPIFLADAINKPVARLAIITIGFLYSCILWIKMMTTSISIVTWKIIIFATSFATIIYIYLTGKLLQLF